MKLARIRAVSHNSLPQLKGVGGGDETVFWTTNLKDTMTTQYSHLLKVFSPAPFLRKPGDVTVCLLSYLLLKHHI